MGQDIAMGLDDADDRELLMADAKTASLAGGGLGFSVLGWLIPVLSIVGVVLSLLALRSARRDYRVGKVFGVLGLAVGLFALGTWITMSFLRG